jgi:hypothetical protein
MAANTNWTSACSNQIAGMSGQNGGKRTATLYASEQEVLSDVPSYCKVQCSRVVRRALPIYVVKRIIV